MHLISNWIRLMFHSAKITKHLLKGVNKNMTFTKDHPFVKSAVLLFMAGVYENIEDVPNVLNLRQLVKEAMFME